MKYCLNCKQALLSNEKHCTYCGQAKPPPMWQLLFLGFIFAAGIFSWIYTALTDGKSAAEVAAECRKSLQCTYNHSVYSARTACKEAIERHARFDVKWTDTNSPFTEAKWINSNKRIIGLVGDKVRFQNGFGAWQAINYECVWDAEADKLVTVNLAEGRL